MKKVFANWTRERNINAYEQELGPKDFYTSYFALFAFCFVLTFACQGASLLSEYSYFQNIFGVQITGYALMIVTALFCGLIEVSKYFVFGFLLRGIFSIHGKHLSPILLGIALGISTVSIYTSVVGGGKLGIDTSKVIQTESKHDQEIAQIRSEIADIKKRNSWKNATWIVGKEKDLLHQKEAILASEMGKKSTSLAKVASENEAKETEYRWWFASFEVVFIFCTSFVYYFKQRSVVERKFTTIIPIEESKHKDIERVTELMKELLSDKAPNRQEPLDLGEYPLPKPNNAVKHDFKKGFKVVKAGKEKIAKVILEDTGAKVEEEISDFVQEDTALTNDVTPFVEKPQLSLFEVMKVVEVKEGYRICKHCGKDFEYKIHNQKFCTEPCRIAFWETKTDKTLTKKRKKA